MLTLQGTWIPERSTSEAPALSFWIGAADEAEDSNLALKLDEFEDAVHAVFGNKHSFLFFQEDRRVYLSCPVDQVFNILELLVCLEHAKAWKDWGFQIGESLILWNAAARLSLEWLLTKRYVPSVHANHQQGKWDIIEHDPRLEHRLLTIQQSMSKPMHSNMLHFIKYTIDAAARQSILETDAQEIMESAHAKFAAPLTPSEHWLKSLLVHEPQTDSSLEWITDELVDWQQLITEQLTQSSFRTCFRLEEPEAVPGDEAASSALRWRLRFMLQAIDDPSLLVPAELVWKDASETLEYLNVRFHQPQERLLLDLARSAKVFQPIQEALETGPNPSYCDLDIEEAYAFLNHAANELAVANFGVFIPNWWRRSDSQVGVSLKLKPAQADADLGYTSPRRASQLGFNALFDYEWRLAIGDEELSREQFEQLSSLKEPLVQVNGQWVELQPEHALQALSMLERKGSMKASEAIHLALSAANSSTSIQLPHEESLSVPIHNVAVEGMIGTLIEQLQQGKRMEFIEQPKALQGSLRAYQQNGFSWLVFMRNLQLGACLADDMGLGKTIQWLSYILHLKHKQQLNGPVLLICPTSVLGNWEREIERFAPSLKVWVHYGPDRVKGEQFIQKAEQHDLVMTSYAVAMRDEDDIVPISWDVITLDEAQNIKNTISKQTQVIRKISAKHRIALTGTPVENRLAELWSIMDFLNPSYLGSQEQFIKKFETPIERDHDSHTTQMLHRIIQPFVLRRLKSDRKVIQDIPEKLENKVLCTLTQEQAALYEACVQQAFQKVEKAHGMERRGMILSTITQLKQICNHPAHYLGDRHMNENRSGKMKRLVEMLQDIRERGERVLIFSQYAQMAILLQSYLEQRFAEEVLMIHGRVPKRKRDEMIARFQEDSDAPAIFVLSLKTGGFGLNLTRANHVIHYDRWWNPAVENQATDRVYRIGQKKDVEVHKFLCVGTLEEKINQMIENKESLAEQVIGKGEAWITEMSTDDLKDLFTLRRDMLIAEEEDWVEV